MKKIIETQRLTAEDVRRLCCKYELYTRGTNEDYEAMFKKVRSLRGPIITAEDLYPIAADILDHSEPANSGGITSILWVLGKAIHRHYEVEEGGRYVVTCEGTVDGPEYMIYSDGQAHRAFEVVVAEFDTYAEAVAYKRGVMAI